MTKKKLYIHIGPHKTGSTFLQKKVFPSLVGIEYIGRFYTDANQSMNMVVTENYGFFMKWVCEGDCNSLRKFVEKILDDINNSFLFSDEWLSAEYSGKFYHSAPWNVKMERLCELKKYFDLKLIYFTRRPSDAVFSLYREFVKSGIFSSDESLLKFCHSEDAVFYNYRKSFIYLASSFGDDNILTLRYDPESVDVSTVCALLDCDISGEISDCRENCSVLAGDNYAVRKRPQWLTIMPSFLYRNLSYLSKIKLFRMIYVFFMDKFSSSIVINNISLDDRAYIDEYFEWED
ncbi:hypothetical protein [Amphritea pacifica]|uniref:Sulfotransferase domain-containing protein n=1 Tax=Amphritea pacifica TaxID=2811233 RepID=A0ABS2W574_9GAMM|nr:hypothetical protein [Amphritea pacifica]MBN0986868.1 hypothetical protein [Amphritea pacifica]